MNRAVLKDYTDQELLDSARDQRTKNRRRKNLTPRQKEANDRAENFIADQFDKEIAQRNEERENHEGK